MNTVMVGDNRKEPASATDNAPSHQGFYQGAGLLDTGLLSSGLLNDGGSLDAGLLSCLSIAQPASEMVVPILFGGQYRRTDLPIIFLVGRGPLARQFYKISNNAKGRKREATWGGINKKILPL